MRSIIDRVYEGYTFEVPDFKLAKPASNWQNSHDEHQNINIRIARVQANENLSPRYQTTYNHDIKILTCGFLGYRPTKIFIPAQTFYQSFTIALNHINKTSVRRSGAYAKFFGTGGSAEHPLSHSAARDRNTPVDIREYPRREMRPGQPGPARVILASPALFWLALSIFSLTHELEACSAIYRIPNDFHFCSLNFIFPINTTYIRPPKALDIIINS